MMKFLSSHYLTLAMLLLSGKVLAMNLDGVTLLETSSSEKSIVIDKGLLENYQEGIYAKFFVQAGDFKFPKIFLVAEGRLVKSFPKKSFWYLSKIYIPNLIKIENHFLVITSTEVKSGRPITQKQRHVLVSPDRYETLEEFKAKNQNNVPQRLLQQNEDYEKSAALFDTKKVPEADQLIETYETFGQKQALQYSEDFSDGLEEKYFFGNKEVQLASLGNEEDKKLLDSMANGYVDKINSQKYPLENGLYKNQKKAAFSHEINGQMVISSVYDSLKEEQSAREIIDPKAEALIKRDGAQWSEGMDDETLRRYFISTGLEHEVKRRELALNELDGNEILLHYTGSLSDHSTNADENHRNLGFSLGLGYDFHLSRINKEYKDWTIQVQAEQGYTDFNIGGKNGRGLEGAYGIYLNYYFINNPLTLDTFNFLAGIGLRAGSIKMKNSNLSQEYTYQVLSLPSIQLMGKYRFRSGDLTESSTNIGLSFNAGFIYDIKRLSVIESLQDNINGKISIKDIKYLIGLSFYF